MKQNKKNKEKDPKINHLRIGVEMLWLIIAAAATGLALHGIIVKGFEHSYQMLIVAAVAFGMYMLRRRMRKRRSK